MPSFDGKKEEYSLRVNGTSLKANITKTAGREYLPFVSNLFTYWNPKKH